MKVNESVPIITIDGPSGTGKGTVSHLLATHLHWHLLDSGCIYRLLAFAVAKYHILLDNKKAIGKLAKTLDFAFETSKAGKTEVFLEGELITEKIRTEQCGQDASKIAVYPEVRGALLMRQRDFARLPGLVADGRDMGTIVFPEALLKIYLHATLKERALRRYLQLKEKGIGASLGKIIDELAQRDARDATRSHAPLKPAEDAVIIDTTGITIVQVFDNILKLVNEKLVFVN